ncbi:hypothetical protein [Kineococcus glutinatus]
MSTQPSAESSTVGHVTSSSGGDPQHEQRALAPIRWPKPSGGTVAALVVWAIGLVVAVVVPAIIAPPEFGMTSSDASGTADPAPPTSVSGTAIGLAMGVTVLGCLVMLFSAYALHRRTGSIGAAILAFVPTFVVVASGAIIATMLLLA